MYIIIIIIKTVFYVCIEYCIQVNMYDVSAQGFDERMINVRYYYYYVASTTLSVCVLFQPVRRLIGSENCCDCHNAVDWLSDLV